MSEAKPVWVIDYGDQKALLKEYRQAFRNYVRAEKESESLGFVRNEVLALRDCLRTVHTLMTDETRAKADRWQKLYRAQRSM